jgi:hypothetical protein
VSGGRWRPGQNRGGILRGGVLRKNDRDEYLSGLPFSRRWNNACFPRNSQSTNSQTLYTLTYGVSLNNYYASPLLESVPKLLWYRRVLASEKLFSASQSGKYSVTLHFRSREVRFPVQCQKFLVECGKNLVEYGKNVRTPLIYSLHS